MLHDSDRNKRLYRVQRTETYEQEVYAELRALFDPAARCRAEYVNPTMPSEFGVDAFIAETAKTDPADHIIVNGLTWDGADTVVADVAPVFATAPPLAHPVTGTVTFKVQGGRVAYWEFRFSAQTRQDIGAAMAAASSAGSTPRGISSRVVGTTMASSSIAAPDT